MQVASLPKSKNAKPWRILLTGRTGQLGHELRRALAPFGEIIAPGRAAGAGLPALDLASEESIRAAVRLLNPQLIVNAAAYTAVDRAEAEADAAMAINGVAPGILAEEAVRCGAVLIHYSTDYVFDGSGTVPWREDDPTGPLSAYGRGKWAGEQAVRAAGAAHWILRTSWVHGVYGANFVRTMLRLGAERPSLSVVNDQFGAPTSARVIADMTYRLLLAAAGPDIKSQQVAAFAREHGGVLHLTCAGETNWHEFAQEIFRQAEVRGARLSVQEVRGIPSREYPTPAARPLNSRLDGTRLRERLGAAPPDWREALEQTLDGLIGPRTASRTTIALLAASMSAATPPATAPDSTADLDIGVIFTHEKQWMPPLLSTLAASGNDVRMRLLLVDNASADGVAEWESYLSTTVLRNATRLRYGANLNRILAASSAPLVLLLNTDMEFDPSEQCLAKMVRFMREHPDCGVSGCRLYRRDGTYGFPARRFQTWRTVAARRTPLAPLLRDEVRRYQYGEYSAHETFDCDWLSGCFLLVRRQAYLDVGGFDCGFSKYFEDVDFCLRMAQAGWRVMFHGAAFCFHEEQRASRSLISRDALLHARAYGRWLRKWGRQPARRAS